MKTFTKKTLSIFLSLLMLLSCLAGLDFSTYAVQEISNLMNMSNDDVRPSDDNINLSIAYTDNELNENQIMASTAEEMKCVPTYIKKDGNVHMLYNPETASLAAFLSKNVYDIKNNKEGVIENLNDLGYQQIKIFENSQLIEETNETDGDAKIFSSLNATIGIKKVSYNGVSKYAIAIAFRGSNDLQDWLFHNANITRTDGFHSGFLSIAGEFLLECENIYFEIDKEKVYLSDIIRDMQKENSKYSMLVTGHSLGGAVADCFSGYYLYKAGVHPSNVVTYTFAASLSAPIYYNYPHDNIFNIISNDDIVPKVGNFNGRQIGKNIYYQPDEAFRLSKYYDYSSYDNFDDYMGEVLTFVTDLLSLLHDCNIRNVISVATDTNKLIKMFLSMHNMENVYFPIVDSINNDVNRGGNQYFDINSTTRLTRFTSNTSLNSGTFNHYKSLSVDEYKTLSIDNCVVSTDGNMRLNNFTRCTLSGNSNMTVGGNVYLSAKEKAVYTIGKDSVLNIKNDFICSYTNPYDYKDFVINGTVNIFGNLTVTNDALNTSMSSDGKLNIYGNCIYNAHSNSPVSNGIITVKGDIETSGVRFTDKNKIILYGNEPQNVSITECSNIEFKNPSGINITKCYVYGTIYSHAGYIVNNTKNIRLSGNIDGEFWGDIVFQNANFYSNAVIHGNVYLRKDSNVNVSNEATLIINGDLVIDTLDQLTVTIHKGATLKVRDNLIYSQEKYSNLYKSFNIYGTLDIGGYLDLSFKAATYLLLSNDAQLKIKKYFSFESYSQKTIDNGTISIGGSLYGNTDFTGNSKVILNGSSTQYVYLSTFATLVLENPKQVRFSNAITVTKLFNHNGNPFVLYNNGEGSSFVDFNGDGLKDNVDPYPARIHYFIVDRRIEPTCNNSGMVYYICSDCGYEKSSSISKLNGTNLSNKLNEASTKLSYNYYTDESKANLNSVYVLYQNALDELHTQIEVNNATVQITEAINNLEYIESFSGVGDNGEAWTWNKEDASLTISGNVDMANYTSTTVPWSGFNEIIEKVVISDGITRIGNYAFNRIPNLKTVEISNTVLSIGKYAFGYDTSLETIVVPNSVSKIEYAAFEYCSSLKNVTVPASTTYGAYAFSNDTEIKEINITKGTDGIMPDCSNTSEGASIFNKEVIGSFGPWRYASNVTVNIEEGVTSIGKNTFYNANGINEIAIPSSVVNIGESAFYNCTSLQTIYYYDSQSQWNEINIAANNSSLTNASLICNCTLVHPNQNHTFVIDTIKDLTCSQEGELFYTCSICGYSFIEYIDHKSEGIISCAQGVYMAEHDWQRVDTDTTNGYINICNDGQNNSFTIAYYKFDISNYLNNGVTVDSAPFTVSLKEAGEDCQGLTFYYTSNNNADAFTSTHVKSNTSSVFGTDNSHLSKAIDYFGLVPIKSFAYSSSEWIANYSMTVDLAEAINASIAQNRNYVVIMIAQSKVGGSGDTNGWTDTMIKYSTPSVKIEYLDDTLHNYKEIEGTSIKATCTSAGRTADKECISCGNKVLGQEINILPENKTITCLNNGIYMYRYSGSRVNTSSLNGYLTICNDGEDNNFTMAYYRYDVSEYVKNKFYVESAPFTVSLKDSASEDCQGLSFFYTGNSNADGFNSYQTKDTNSNVFGVNNQHINRAKIYYDLHELQSFKYNSSTWTSNYSFTVDIADAINYSIDNDRNYVVIMIAQSKAGGSGSTNGWTDTNIKYGNVTVSATLKKEHLWSNINDGSPKKCIRCNKLFVDLTAYYAAIEDSVVNEDEYTSESFKTYVELINSAKIDIDTASQDDVNSAVSSILIAKDVLVKKNCIVKVYKISDDDLIEVVSKTVKYGDIFNVNVELTENESIYKWTVSNNDRDVKLNTRDAYITQVINGDVEFNCYVDVEPVENSDTAKVVFYDRANRVIALDYMEIGTVVDVSKFSAPRVAFYDFTGWNVVSGNIENITAEGVSLKAEYRPSRIDVNAMEFVGLNGVMINGQTSVKAYYDDKLVLTGADSFAYCDADGKIIQGINGSTIYAPNNYVKLYICSGTSTKASTNINGYNDELPTTTDKGRLTMNAQYYLPDGFTIVDAGVVISSTQSNPTIGEAGCTKLASTQQGAGGEYSISLTYSNGKSGTINAVSYLIYKDTDGLLHTIYSDAKSITFGS